MIFSSILDLLRGEGAQSEGLKTMRFPASEREKKDDDGYYPIECPYCFESFHIWEAEFRSPVIDRAVDEKSSGDSSRAGAQSDNDFENINEYSKPTPAAPQTGSKGKEYRDQNEFPPEDDELYNDFENLVGNDKREAKGKVLKIFGQDGKPTGEVESVIFMNPETEYKYGPSIKIEGHRAADFAKKPILKVINKFKQSCDERICPKCHHRVSNFVGVRPSYSVALIGDTYVGKTVYLIKLGEALTGFGILGGSLGGLQANPDHTDYLEQVAKMEQNLINNEAMTKGTKKAFMPPSIIDLRPNPSIGFKGAILNLFDFPGEALRTENLEKWKDFISHYSNKIPYVDAWMLMFDASSLKTVKNVFDNDNELKKLINTKGFWEDGKKVDPADPVVLLNNFQTHYLGNHAFNKPLAIVISKSDLIKTAYKDHENEFRTLNKSAKFLNPNPDEYRDKEKVDLNDISYCNEMIKTFMSGDNYDAGLYDLCLSVQGTKKEACWFAVSSRGSSQGAIAGPVRIEDPLGWILWRLGLISGKGDPESVPGGGSPIVV